MKNGHPKSKTDPTERDLYATPPDIFERIQAVARITFFTDVCAQAWSAKCGNYWTKRNNALKMKWTDHIDPLQPLWMNPPYSDLPAWTEKAAKEASDGLIVMGLVPDTRSSGWYRHNLDGVASTAFVPDGRINFIKPDGKRAPSNMWPSVFPLWTPWQTGFTQYCYFYRKSDPTFLSTIIQFDLTTKKEKPNAS